MQPASRSTADHSQRNSVSPTAEQVNKSVAQRSTRLSIQSVKQPPSQRAPPTPHLSLLIWLTPSTSLHHQLSPLIYILSPPTNGISHKFPEWYEPLPWSIITTIHTMAQAQGNASSMEERERRGEKRRAQRKERKTSLNVCDRKVRCYRNLCVPLGQQEAQRSVPCDAADEVGSRDLSGRGRDGKVDGDASPLEGGGLAGEKVGGEGFKVSHHFGIVCF
ncbi:unnamed protein product [Pleuronectes platessa]|uniref:Uncharacterized protein n=1 Tax=Pleuronectes platessa TaxID=8262 RepID=A0A9N7Y9X8_PLEPL|nr:unnamed protein product [Pleuronectes platessa]